MLYVDPVVVIRDIDIGFGYSYYSIEWHDILIQHQLMHRYLASQYEGCNVAVWLELALNQVLKSCIHHPCKIRVRTQDNLTTFKNFAVMQ